MTKLPYIAVFMIASMLLSSYTLSEKELRKKHFNLKGGIAIAGYDPVAYFKQGKAIKGDKKYSVLANGILYYCSSESNKASFLSNHISYEPQYGGWCAYAMGEKGEKVQIDPESFKVVNNKLYLFYYSVFNDTRKDWNSNETQLKSKADNNWKKIYQ